MEIHDVPVAENRKHGRARLSASVDVSSSDLDVRLEPYLDHVVVAFEPPFGPDIGEELIVCVVLGGG